GGYTGLGRPLGARTSGVTKMLPVAVDVCLPVRPVTPVCVSRAVSSDAPIQRYLLLEPGILIVAPRKSDPLLLHARSALRLHVIVLMSCAPLPPAKKSPAKLPEDWAGAC